MTIQEIKQQIIDELGLDTPDYYKITDLIYKINVLETDDMVGEQKAFIANLQERKEIQKIDLERELKLTRLEDSYLSLEEITDTILKVFKDDTPNLVRTLANAVEYNGSIIK